MSVTKGLLKVSIFLNIFDIKRVDNYSTTNINVLNESLKRVVGVYNSYRVSAINNHLVNFFIYMLNKKEKN